MYYNVYCSGFWPSSVGFITVEFVFVFHRKRAFCFTRNTTHMAAPEYISINKVAGHKRHRDDDDEEPQRDNRPRYFVNKNNTHIPRALVQVETDEKKLAARQKQIDYGKNTIGYQRYSDMVSMKDRKRSDPWTPDKNTVCSKRSFDGQIKKWRRLLHEYDPPAAEGEIEINPEEEEDLWQLQKEIDAGKEEDEKEDKENIQLKSNIKEKELSPKPEPKSKPNQSNFDYLKSLDQESWADMA